MRRFGFMNAFSLVAGMFGTQSNFGLPNNERFRVVDNARRPSNPTNVERLEYIALKKRARKQAHRLYIRMRGGYGKR